MIEKIKKIVEENPNRIAYKVNEKKITYGELWSLANTYSKYLIKQGTSPVIILGNKGMNEFISIVSCLIAKRTYIPIGLCTPKFRIQRIAEATKSTLILSDINISLDNVFCTSLEGLKKFEKTASNNIVNDIVYMIFTSGSTGDPKGVPISITNLENFVNWISSLYPLNSYKNINVFNQASFSFDLSVADIYYALCNGHTLVSVDDNCEQFDYNKLFDVLKNEDINVAVMTPTFIKMCLLDNNFNSSNYPNFDCIYFCGEQLEVKTVKIIWERFPNMKIINAYGPTEATSAVSGILLDKDMLTKELLPVGEINNFATNIEIINDEIVLKGNSVFSGYLGNIPGGYFREKGINCYRTGDIGYIEDNKLYCKGRIDNQVKYKGYRVELSDIENNINKIKGVRDACVVAKKDSNGMVKSIKAFVVVDDQNIDSTYIKNELANYLPKYMIPKTIKLLNKLPMNQNNKIDRKALLKL